MSKQSRPHRPRENAIANVASEASRADTGSDSGKNNAGKTSTAAVA
jgi:hypothetical protein